MAGNAANGTSTTRRPYFVQPTMRRDELFRRISEELDRAYAKHGAELWGRHEFYGIIKEEFTELETAIFTDEPMGRVLDELTQVAAMCFRYFETGDRYQGPHP